MYRQSEKNLLSSNTSSTCPSNMVNFGPLAAEIVSLVWGTLQISTGFASWQRYWTASSSDRQPNFSALNRGRHLCSAGRPSRWALGQHSSLLLFSMRLRQCVEIPLRVCFRLKSSLSLSSSSSLSSADMINSDRVTSSSDDLSHVITSSPPASSRRHGDAMRDGDVNDDVDDDDDGRNSLPSRLDRDESRHVISESLSTVFTHSQAQSPVSSVCNWFTAK